MHWPQSTQEWFYNYTGSPVTVASVAILGDTTDFRIQPGQNLCTDQTLQNGDGCRVTVVLGPLPTTGPISATLELTDSNANTVDVPMTATGLTGTLSTQSSLDFGSQPINKNNGGGSQQESVTVNDGPYWGARVTNVQINGPDASSFNVSYNGCQGYVLGADGNCQIQLNFQPSSVGPEQAQLEIDNDGTTSPLFVSLSGVGLSGAALTVNPPQAVFGNTPLGSSTSQTLTLTNTGDAPLQIQELFLVAGSPQVFPMSDGCSGQQLAPGALCQVTVGFIPIALGVKDASLLMIDNIGPVTVIGLSGTGVAPYTPPSGTARVTGTPQAGHTLTCSPGSFPTGSTLGYQWLRNGHSVPGATGPTLSLTNSDVGARFSCRVSATTPSGTQSAASSFSAPVRPSDLRGLRYSTVGEGTCRVVSVARYLPDAVHAIAPSPVTSWAPFELIARARMQVRLDGHTLGSGSLLRVSPQALLGFADGVHTLQVEIAGRTDRAALVLAPCRLLARLQRSDGQSSVLTISSRTGISSLNVVLPRGLRIDLARRNPGQLWLERPGVPARSFALQGARTVVGSVTVTLSASGIVITGLPSGVGVIKLKLGSGVLLGRGGALTVRATVSGIRHRLATSTG